MAAGSGIWAAIAVATAAFALPAAASAPVELRPSPASHGASITLGDLFEGAGAAASVSLGDAAPVGGEAVLEAGRVQAVARRAGLAWSNASGRSRVIVASLEGPRLRLETGAVAGRRPSRRARRVLAYARALNAGDVVAASDVVWSDEAVGPADAPQDADEVIGKAARRPLREGSAVGVHDLANPRVIKRDDLVQAAFEEDGVTLVLEAKALSDAAVGETLQLVNVQSKKVLEAVASGPGRAAVGPQAERLKSEASASSTHLAER